MKKKSFIILFCISLLFAKCNTYKVELEKTVDRDIVLLNIEQGDRALIGRVLQKVDSLHPLVVGVDITFQGRKKSDSILLAAFKQLKNDILVYSVSPDGAINKSDSAFTNFTDQGNLYYEQRMGLITSIVPLQRINDKVHESLAYKMVKQWQPNFISPIKVDQKIDIVYSRNLSKFNTISGSELLRSNAADYDLANKVFLVGYAGPGNEDKHFTPLRHIEGDFKTNEPDTYGLVIIANEIRTILDYKKN